MPIIISSIIESTPRGNGENYVMFRFATDVGDVLTDGPRFLDVSTDLNVLAPIIGARILEAKAQQEIALWLVP